MAAVGVLSLLQIIAVIVLTMFRVSGVHPRDGALLILALLAFSILAIGTKFPRAACALSICINGSLSIAEMALNDNDFELLEVVVLIVCFLLYAWMAVGLVVQSRYERKKLVFDLYKRYDQGQQTPGPAFPFSPAAQPNPQPPTGDS